jgi:energy-coupling factor transporter ATP-binding protein EcfA2
VLTRLTVCNFKKFDRIDVELGNPVVFIGPNNSGKSTALQALALWNIGLQQWTEKRTGKARVKRPGVTINRRDLIAMPVPSAILLWRDLHVREGEKSNGKQRTQNVRVDITVEGVGVTDQKPWKCGFEFDYANEESFYCRPIRLSEGKDPQRMEVPPEAAETSIAFLPPMSGLADRETRKQPGEVNFLIGQGRTAEVLRNLCHSVATSDEAGWKSICLKMKNLFGATLDEPKFVAERGEITMTYSDKSDVRLDISSSGRGLQQTLLILAYMTVHRGAVLLLDEPDAHLEILRQRQIYELLSESARIQGSQIIAASHSEVILNEAADRDVVVAFVGKPHRIDDRGSQVLKSLREIGFDQYYQAEQTGWVLYVEGSTDLAILQAFARKLEHPAQQVLEMPFVHYVTNLPAKAREHFFGLREAKVDLVGFALFDRVDQALQPHAALKEYQWKRREIENYLAAPAVLLAYAQDKAKESGPLFEPNERKRRTDAMQECIEDLAPRAAIRDLGDRWWIDTKMSDDFLDRVFESFFKKLGLPNLMRKTDYHVLADFVAKEQIDAEVVSVLDEIVKTQRAAKPLDG